MSEIEIQKKLYNALKLSGFIIRREFCSLLVNKFIEQDFDLEDPKIFDNIITNLCSNLERQCLSDQSIEREHIIRAFEFCMHLGYDRYETVINVVSAFDFPKLTFNVDRKQYYIDQNKSILLSDADKKAKLFEERYSTILQRTKRVFQQNINREKAHLKLQTIDFLLTVSHVTLDHTLILGCLTQVSEGKYFLEDPTGMVELTLAFAKYHSGFFVENCFVLVNGYYEDRLLHVSTIALPPGEDYKNSRPSFGNINYFGGLSNIPLRDSQRLKEQMTRDKNKIMLFFSDVWFDHPLIFEKFNYLFQGLQDMPPIAFVFMGNFLSNTHGCETMNSMKKLLKQFAELILKFSNISQHSQFIFVPGFSDPCTAHVVPRFSLPDYVTSDMKKLLPKVVFTTNPCRLQYCTREIIVFRADLAAKFLQGTLHKPSKDEIGDFVKRTLISQGHLSPLSLNALPVHWDFDYCLRLYPLPDLIVIGDKSDAYQGSYKDCHVINPGSFCEKGFQFKSYIPFSNQLEDCELDTGS